MRNVIDLGLQNCSFHGDGAHAALILRISVRPWISDAEFIRTLFNAAAAKADDCVRVWKVLLPRRPVVEAVRFPPPLCFSLTRSSVRAQVAQLEWSET